MPVNLLMKSQNLSPDWPTAEIARIPALGSYVSALEHLVPGAVKCHTGPSESSDLCSADVWCVSVPIEPSGQSLYVRVDPELAAEYGSPPPFWRKPVVLRMLKAMEQNFSGRTRLRKWPDAVRTAWSLLSQHPRRAMSLGELAGCLKLSAGYLGARIEEILGSTFRCLLRDERIAVACDSLLNTDLRISEIADGLGGQSLSQFNRNFSAATGLTPRSYRQKYGGGRHFSNDESESVHAHQSEGSFRRF